VKKVMFISSGGGHFSELLRLTPLFDRVEAHFVLEKQAYDFSLPHNVAFLPRGSRKHKLRYAFVFPVICCLSVFYYMKFRPDAVVTTGAHTAVPMCYIASLFNKDIIFIESIARVHSKSLSGKLIEKKCTHILVQWESMCKVYSKASYRGQLL